MHQWALSQEGCREKGRAEGPCSTGLPVSPAACLPDWLIWRYQVHQRRAPQWASSMIALRCAAYGQGCSVACHLQLPCMAGPHWLVVHAQQRETVQAKPSGLQLDPACCSHAGCCGTRMCLLKRDEVRSWVGERDRPGSKHQGLRPSAPASRFASTPPAVAQQRVPQYAVHCAGQEGSGAALAAVQGRTRMP